MAHLHLIESRHDIDLAKAIVQELEYRDNKVTWDVNYLVPGEEWKRSLNEAILACDGIVAILTNKSVSPFNGISAHISSQWMAADIGAAKAYGKFIIPVIIGEDVMIPALVDDIFTLIERDASKTKDIAAQIHEAANVHMTKKPKQPLIDIPPGYNYLSSAVIKFQEFTPYNKSVFVMMKFPDANLNDVQNKMLQDIWDELDKVLHAYGLTARRADKKTYHDQMWENICVYMLGCKYGVAILEDRAAKELNPNVTLEYGFMKAFNKNVVLLRDINFNHDRADLIGKIAKPFEVDIQGVLNKDSFRKAIEEWLVDEGIQKISNI